MMKRIALLVMTVCALAAPSLRGAEPTKYELEAVFLFNFTQFVNWPDSSFTSPTSPFTICILGEDPFDGTLDETVRNETVQRHPIQLRRIAALSEASTCHILFVSTDAVPGVQDELKGMEDKPVLTISDRPEFVEQGGIMAFRDLDRQLTVRINLPAARSAKLTISSKLLRLAEVIGE